MEKSENSNSLLKTKSKTLRLKVKVIDEIDALAEQDNRNFNNMAETLMKLGMKYYPKLELRA